LSSARLTQSSSQYSSNEWLSLSLSRLLQPQQQHLDEEGRVARTRSGREGTSVVGRFHLLTKSSHSLSKWDRKILKHTRYRAPRSLINRVVAHKSVYRSECTNSGTQLFSTDHHHHVHGEEDPAVLACRSLSLPPPRAGGKEGPYLFANCLSEPQLLLMMQP
jgi:hypothetical protein